MALTASTLERGICLAAECGRSVVRDKGADQQRVQCAALNLHRGLRKHRPSKPFGPSASSHVGFARASTFSQVSSLPVTTNRQWINATQHARQSSRVSMMAQTQEQVFFDGGPHWGDLAVNLVFGVSVVWLPLTVAAIARGLLARYRFTDQRVTIIGGFSGEDRRDFSYKEIKDVKYVPRFLGDWGDIVISLNNGDQIELQRIPKHKEIAAYVEKQVAAVNAGSAKSTAAKN